MRKGKRFSFTAAGKAELWDRWQREESQRSIGRAFGKQGLFIYNQLVHTGGIRPRPRHRSKRALTLSEREEISRRIVAEQSIRSIAKLLGRAPSTVSREIGLYPHPKRAA